MRGDIVVWFSGRGISGDDWDRIFGKRTPEQEAKESGITDTDPREITSNTDESEYTTGDC